ncbi:DUF4440 domain-containing protein [Pseudomonas cremoricolorata]|uniref:DUF4440 domain-containing protein n=1 Tax=Pseudomonas cremoricolorata TaxID=157783 RepID=A0A089WWM7_9PSED|nr:DUF4440 domain-containing protein [Pseudomonas cremoricolorata]AIR91022.1 hypothetical protein LK03_17885 [Pseudomonas cremoricolorata]
MDTDIKRQLLNLERELLQPQTRRDPRKLDQLLADTFIEFTASGSTCNKPQAINALHSETPNERILENFHLQVLTPDVAVATYRCVQRDEHGAMVTSLRSSVWRLGVVGWQMVFHQGTRVDR